MTFSLNTSLSAVMAYGKKMGVHANNIANMYSEDFNRSRVRFTEGAGQTVTAEIEEVASPVYPVSGTDENQLNENESNPAGAASNDSLVDNTTNNVDLATEIVQTNIAQNGYEANLKIIQTQDEMIGTVLDLIS
jgi:flagellar basal body rod protein FlgG